MRRSLLLACSAAKGGSWASMPDAEIMKQVENKKIAFYGLEQALAPDYDRAIAIRREIVKKKMCPSTAATHPLERVPYKNYDWSSVVGQSCENILGYVPVPVGLAGPLLLDGKEVALPMATTEGALVASAHRGARAINLSGGCRTAVLKEGMTRAPVVEVNSFDEAITVIKFCEERFDVLKEAFESTTRFGKLLSIKCAMAGRQVHMRFSAFTGDAMGMNMITKGCDKALQVLQQHIPSVRVLTLSGNFCTDKKPSALNWVEGRGKSVVAEAVIKRDVVEGVLKCTVDSVVSLNVTKNLRGSALAGSIGGFNAHAANIVAALYIATGQDPAQIVESATCMTTVDKAGEDLVISLTMPSIEVGAVGGGTGLSSQRAMLELMGCAGSNKEDPGANSRQIARVVAGAVICGELSLLSGLAAGHLLSAHMKLNRKPPTQ
ncbi:3-hydroxy-3-methylglutaryl-CoA reductase / HMGR [Leishmania donovani]|uniref:3-hydroxy-3-methylglutaryl coenzyme A reductase n=4 Tax=Leishmania donovani species complex TaxID=38574 RepID=A0A6L0XW09_LEIIN|nr:putative 3-hydroxy-3-methylglutaryl-CoA reductase [Leishmania infantum JPCM5]XP_003863034.1 3-hydroxy-3-methylglutaryl-CoA reductase, putative [Leishmania donovani]CAC9515726.1 3-hydroxy-3-methylglutaryl-CoA_reductase [Leishmania infantum]AYU81123.1 3-hydroxy-3-methylglutaryl-CoA reductase [Leishmania donovani]CAJ1991116.1 3-hydroxy-3-methylglutaryl-CoA reductase / HMGR [Leishmania donovani]CAM70224.1 putative 3-hydroxy-3-methylglutaryl-CoA reductase [Leishmania infantum JPCM5]CBZ36344.1 3|eukprot:XP_001467171.1 putative 3-hydroxy-3-methylglutaryl-CoA reductase [Leishmania infantum JPCM5]